MPDQTPSIGRIVHYVSYGTPGGEYTSECRAAIVTAVDTENEFREPDAAVVSLTVFNPEGMFFNQHCRQNEDRKPGGTWHWPERV